MVTEYLGTGDLGQLMAKTDAMDRERRELEREAIRVEREGEREIDRTLDAAGDLLRKLTYAVLVANGYHQHKGQWRRRRGERSDGD